MDCIRDGSCAIHVVLQYQSGMQASSEILTCIRLDVCVNSCNLNVAMLVGLPKDDVGDGHHYTYCQASGVQLSSPRIANAIYA